MAKFGQNKTSVIISVILVFLLSSIACVACSCGAPSFSKEMQDSLNTTLDNAMKDSEAPGAITGIWAPEGTWVVAKGKADVEEGVSIKTTDIFRIGSITKTFVATVVLILADEGKLNLDDTIDNYVPDFPNGNRITVSQLLGHTSGIPSWDTDDELREDVQNNPDKGWTVDKMIELVGQQPLLFEPGTDYFYSNIGYFLLGKIIEEVTGNTVEDEIKTKIVEPLGLENTFLPDGPEFEGETVHGYEVIDGEIVDTTGTKGAEVVNYDLAYTAGGMVSTVDDLKVWAKALATGELLSEEMHEEQMPKDLKASSGSPVKGGYGLGVSQQDVWIGHSGAVAGFMVNLGYYPEKDATIVTFFNKLSALDIEANEAELKVYGSYFVELSKIVFPDTYEGVSIEQD